MSLRLGINLGYQDWANGLPAAIATAQRAESLGFHSAWTAEAYGTDAVTPLTWLMAHTERMEFGPAIMQMPARTPAMTAMTAATLDGMSGGRFLWASAHRVRRWSRAGTDRPYGKPLVRTREYVEIVREILKREKPLEHHGEHYDIPYNGPDATGLGKPLKIIVHPRRADIPIYLAAIGPKNVALAAEIADGWLPIFFSPYRVKEAFGGALDEGFARAGGGQGTRRLRHRPDRHGHRRRRPRDARELRPADGRAVRRRHGRAREELLQRPRVPLRVRGRGEGDPGPLPRRQEAGGGRGGPVRDGRRGLRCSARRNASPTGSSAWREAGVTTMILGAQQPEALELMAELVN